MSLFLGEGSMKVSSLYQLIATMHQDHDIHLMIYDKATKTTSGRLIVKCCMIDTVPITSQDPNKPSVLVPQIELAPSFLEGVLFVNKISVHDLKLEKKSWLTSSKAIASVSIGMLSFKSKENTIITTGTDHGTRWETIDMSGRITAEEMKRYGLRIDLHVNGSVQLIGEVPNIIQAAQYVKIAPNDEIGGIVSNIGKEIMFEALLQDISKKNTARVNIHLMIRDMETVYIAPKAVEGKASAETGNEALDIDLKASFEYGMLTISRIQCKELQNTEFIGKSDAYVTFEVNNEIIGQTEVKDNIGADPIWDQLFISHKVTREDVLGGHLMVKLWDKNSLRSNVLIGASKSLRLAHFGYNIGIDCDIHETIYNKHNQITGKICLTGNIQEIEAKTLPTSFTTGLLRFLRIKLTNLKNTELLGKQDPYVVIKIEEMYSERTYTANNKGGEVLFDDLHLKTTIASEIIHSKGLTLEVWDKNTMMKDVLIGQAHCVLRDEIRSMNEDITIRMILHDQSHEVAGYCQLYLRLEDMPVEDVYSSLWTDQSCLYIRKISLQGLKSSSFIPGSSSYPFLLYELHSLDDSITDEAISIKTTSNLIQAKPPDIPPVKTKKGKLSKAIEQAKDLTKDANDKVVVTNPKMNAVLGSGQTTVRKTVDENSLWDMLDIRMENISQSNVLFGCLFVTIKEKSSNPLIGDSILGMGRVSIKSTALESNYQRLTELEMDIFPPNTKKMGLFQAFQSKPSNAAAIAKLTVYAELNEQEKDAIDSIDEKFLYGKLRIQSIKAFDLFNTEMFGSSQDPYIAMNIDDLWSETTHVRNNSGSEASWDVNIETDVYRETVMSKKLSISVNDKNTSRKDAIIGTVSTSLFKPASKKYLNKNHDIYLNISNASGQITGRLVITWSINIIDMIPEAIPDDFTGGTLTINHITLILPTKSGLSAALSSVASSEGFLTFYMDGMELRTDKIKILDEEMKWKYTNLQFPCSKKLVHTGNIIAKYFHTNSLSKDNLVGQGEVILSKTGSFLGRDTTLTIDLKPLKGTERFYELICCDLESSMACF